MMGEEQEEETKVCKRVRKRRRRRRRRAERKGKRMNCKNEFLEEKLRICAHSLTCAAHPGNGKVALKYVIFLDIFKRIYTL